MMAFALAPAPVQFLSFSSRSAALPFIEEDELVGLLHQAAESELDGLVECLVKRGGITGELGGLPVYKSNHPRHRAYVNEIAAELQMYGANTIASLFRSGKGVPYAEIVHGVAGRLGVSKRGSSAEIEGRILEHLANKYWEGANADQRAALLKHVGVLDHKLVTLPVLPVAVSAAVHMSGFAAYQLTVIIANAVAHVVLGQGLSLAANAALTHGVSVLAGPPAWCLTGLLTASSLASPAYRVTIPAVVQVALIRNAVKARREQQFGHQFKEADPMPKWAIMVLCVIVVLFIMYLN